MKTLFWVTRELRLDDNPALLKAAASDALVLAFCVDPRWFRALRYHNQSMGPHRWNFLQESLSDFNRALLPLGQKLTVIYQYPETALAELVSRHGIRRLVCSRQFGWDERQVLQRVQERFPDLVIEQVDSYTLLVEPLLPFPVQQIPPTYSKFRRQVEKLSIPPPAAPPVQLPPAPGDVPVTLQRPAWIPAPRATDCPFRGGESAAREHLSDYFNSDHPLHYKEVRNELDGWHNSSKFSPWLNSGCLSPRRFIQALTDYEAAREHNESTYWLFVELLWREYFQWLAIKLGSRLFTLQGTAAKRPMNCFHPDRFQMWCAGTTPFPLVNACMRELAATGYLSNRGRQIAASCLVNELGLDWRYGAAWFENQLVDYDVAVNWGNWQYIAGVGADPRGGRHFNLERQTGLYDSDGHYRQRWTSGDHVLPLDSRDAADWPLQPGNGPVTGKDGSGESDA